MWNKSFQKENINFLKNWQDKTNESDPFGDFDLLMSAAYSGQKIVEYPIYYRRRLYGKTQISRFRDGFKLLKYIVKTFFFLKQVITLNKTLFIKTYSFSF